MKSLPGLMRGGPTGTETLASSAQTLFVTTAAIIDIVQKPVAEPKRFCFSLRFFFPTSFAHKKKTDLRVVKTYGVCFANSFFYSTVDCFFVFFLQFSFFEDN